MKDLRRFLENAYDLLFEAYGPQHWWPGETPWEICVGAVLTQNTNWTNVEKAIANLKGLSALDPELIVKMPADELAMAIRPSGYFNLKAQRLRSVAQWWLASVRKDRLHPASRALDVWRRELLAVNGVGPETADSILLYSFDQPIFVIDAYTRRLMARHLGTPEQIAYHELQALFMENLPHDPALYNEYHALLVRNAKDECRKRECLPGCPLRNLLPVR